LFSLILLSTTVVSATVALSSAFAGASTEPLRC